MAPQSSRQPGFSLESMDALLVYLKEFENPDFDIGQRPCDEEKGWVLYPFMYSEPISDFIQATYDHGWIDPNFDWGEWVNEAMSYVESPEKLRAADLIIISQLLTAHIRGDRFTDGHLAAMFENGHIVKVLLRLQEIRKMTFGQQIQHNISFGVWMVDYLRYYNLEAYLFEDVNQRFHAEGFLSAFDFFSIVIWKANRAKTKVAQRLLEKGDGDELDSIVRDLTKSLHETQTPRDRLKIMMAEWGFRLPMASAVLTVLWPESFTVYDVRVCNQLGQYHHLANWTRFDRIWPTYEQFCQTVRANSPEGYSLRDSDKYLWGKSSATQLQQDIERSFGKGTEKGAGLKFRD